MLPLISFIQGQGRSQVKICWCSHTVTAQKCAVQRLDDWCGTWRRWQCAAWPPTCTAVTALSKGTRPCCLQV